jgi:hypothetical protein
MVGYLANSALPRLGEILKCSFLARYEKLRADKLIGTILIERTFDIICYLVFIGLTLLVQIDLVGGFIKQKLNALARTSRMPFWGKLLILAGGIALLYLLLKFLFRKFPHNRLLIRIKQLLGGISMGFKTIKSLQKRKLFLAHTFFIWTMYLLQIYVGFHAISGTSELSIKAACTVLTLATLAMIATPGGIGSFPLFVMETLTIYGIASPVGKAFGWLIWGVSTGFIICAGLICLLILPYINRKPQKNEIHSGHTG